MKVLIVICALAAIALGHEFKVKTPEEFKKTRAECMKEVKLSPERLESVKKFEYPDDESVYKFVKCTSDKLGAWINGEGFHKEDLIKQFGQEAAPVIEKCLTKKNDKWSDEKWAWNDWKCMTEGGLVKFLKKIVE